MSFHVSKPNSGERNYNEEEGHVQSLSLVRCILHITGGKCRTTLSKQQYRLSDTAASYSLVLLLFRQLHVASCTEEQL